MEPLSQYLALSKGVSMEIISKLKTSIVVLLSLFSSSAFAGIAPPVSVPEPSVLALMGAGVVAVFYVTKKRKK